MTYEKNLERLADISRLEPDWNGYGAPAFTQDVLDLGKFFLDQINQDIQPDLYPTGRDTVQFEWEMDNLAYLEAEVYKDKVSICWVPPVEEGEEDKRAYGRAVELDIPFSRFSPLFVAQYVNILVQSYYKSEGQIGNVGRMLLNAVS